MKNSKKAKKPIRNTHNTKPIPFNVMSDTFQEVFIPETFDLTNDEFEKLISPQNILGIVRSGFDKPINGRVNGTEFTLTTLCCPSFFDKLKF